MNRRIDREAVAVAASDWAAMSLGDCCTFANERVDPGLLGPDALYIGLEHIEPGVPYMTRWGLASEVTSQVVRFEAGDTLFGRLRPYLRKVVFAEGPGFCSPEILILRPHSEIVESRYLHLIASSATAIEYAIARSAGSRMPRTSVDDLAALPVRIPQMGVQRRIVDLMAHLDNLLANLHAERSSVHNLVMAAGRAPRGLEQWPSRPLGDVARLYQPVTLSKADIQEGGPYVVFGANGPIGTHTEFNHPESQVAVTCRGATCGTVNWTPPNCWITGNAMVVSGDEAVLRKRFAYWALQYVVDVSRTISGSAQPQITRTSLAPLLFPVPPLDVQDEYIVTLDAFERSEQAIECEFEALTRLRTQLLSGLLAGNLAIPDRYDALLDEVAS